MPTNNNWAHVSLKENLPDNDWHKSLSKIGWTLVGIATPSLFPCLAECRSFPFTDVSLV
jgi:hypothetical protein